MKNPLDSRAAHILKLGEEGSCWGRRLTVFVRQLKYNDDMSCPAIQFFLTITRLKGIGKNGKLAGKCQEERKPLYRICRGKKGNPAPEIYKD